MSRLQTFQQLWDRSDWRRLQVVRQLQDLQRIPGKNYRTQLYSEMTCQFHQPIGVKHKCASALSLAQSLSAAKLCPTLPVHIEVTTNFYSLRFMTCASKISVKAGRKMLVKSTHRLIIIFCLGLSVCNYAEITTGTLEHWQCSIRKSLQIIFFLTKWFINKHGIFDYVITYTNCFFKSTKEVPY